MEKKICEPKLNELQAVAGGASLYVAPVTVAASAYKLPIFQPPVFPRP